MRRYLRAMGAVALLPYPEGSFATLACPNPPVAPPHAESVAVSERQVDGDAVVTAIAEHKRSSWKFRVAANERTVKEFYTTEEVAKLLGKAEFTVREWCRNGRVRGLKKGSGRGKHQSWAIPHAELLRLKRKAYFSPNTLKMACCSFEGIRCRYSLRISVVWPSHESISR